MAIISLLLMIGAFVYGGAATIPHLMRGEYVMMRSKELAEQAIASIKHKNTGLDPLSSLLYRRIVSYA